MLFVVSVFGYVLLYCGLSFIGSSSLFTAGCASPRAPGAGPAGISTRPPINSKNDIMYTTYNCVCIYTYTYIHMCIYIYIYTIYTTIYIYI